MALLSVKGGMLAKMIVEGGKVEWRYDSKIKTLLWKKALYPSSWTSWHFAV
jgi:hypothetical protein